MLQEHQDSESKSKFIAFITNKQEDESLHKEENNDIVEESKDEKESKNIHINDNDSYRGYFVISKQVLRARLCNKFEKPHRRNLQEKIHKSWM